MPTGRVQRPKEGNDKDPIAGPCPHCGKYVPNDVIHDLQSGRYPQSLVASSAALVKAAKRINRSGHMRHPFGSHGPSSNGTFIETRIPWPIPRVM